MPAKKNNRSTPVVGKKLTGEEKAAAAATSVTRRIISLNNGTWCYLYDVEGRMRHLKVDSDSMQSELAAAQAAGENFINRLLTEMGTLNGDFPAAASRYVRARTEDIIEKAA